MRRLLAYLRRVENPRPFVKTNTQVITVYPISVRDGQLCRAEPWGAEGYTRCPFLRSGYCRLWGFHIDARPDKAASCPVTKVEIPLADD
jgi:hypothetical protein